MKNKIQVSLKNFIEQQAKADEFSGAVLVVKNGQPIFEYTSGFAIRKRKFPIR